MSCVTNNGFLYESLLTHTHPQIYVHSEAAAAAVPLYSLIVMHSRQPKINAEHIQLKIIHIHRIYCNI